MVNIQSTHEALLAQLPAYTEAINASAFNRLEKLPEQANLLLDAALVEANLGEVLHTMPIGYAAANIFSNDAVDYRDAPEDFILCFIHTGGLTFLGNKANIAVRFENILYMLESGEAITLQIGNVLTLTVEDLMFYTIFTNLRAILDYNGFPIPRFIEAE